MRDSNAMVLPVPVGISRRQCPLASKVDSLRFGGLQKERRLRFHSLRPSAPLVVHLFWSELSCFTSQITENYSGPIASPRLMLHFSTGPLATHLFHIGIEFHIEDLQYYVTMATQDQLSRDEEFCNLSQMILPT
ncbi:hypothetical protein Goshw_010688 [Gossypium schwendimanii]|uniref:Uncharacterized protein n=1 Tax=Gossypium schwendimanii TaxID=34291 RepID=A0A7J9L2G0_GOSSC|nr:hypothetical protein [Gossypium schwendimanii]